MNRASKNARFDEVSEADISGLQEALSRGELSCLELIDFFIQRIEGVDRSGPTLKAVLEINPDVRNIARRMDQEIDREKGGRQNSDRRATGRTVREGIYPEESPLPSDKPLFGIPILLKANINTGDEMESDAGSLALTGHRAAEDAPLVKALRDAGAIILGKTNLSEWANFRSTRSVSGWSSRGGQTRNPYVLDRNPCGSSSGSAVAVSAGLCAGAVGTETDGSIICPSSTNGIVGIKPTIGRISTQGIIPISFSQDTAGPMARSVQDGAILLQVMAGQTMEEKPLSGQEGTFPAHPARPTNRSPLTELRDIRIGVVENILGIDSDVDGVFSEALRALKDGGAELIPAPLVDPGEYEAAEMEVLLYEFKAGLNSYLASCTACTGVRSLEDLIAYNNAHKQQLMPHFDQELLLQAASRGSLEDPIYLKARNHAQRLTREDGIDAVMNRLHLHALVAPSGGPAWKTDWINGDHFRIGSSSYAAVSGYPSITLPAGFIRELPVGISFFGRPWSEGELINIAWAFEEITRCRKAPKFLPSIEMALPQD